MATDRMRSGARAPKQWCLTKFETINSFESWRQNLLYILSLDPVFTDFLADGSTWEKKTRSNPLRGFVSDGSSVPEAKRRTANQKVRDLELMLGQIANYCPVISRNTIVKNSTSVNCIWQAIRLHFGFQTSGAHFLDFSTIKLEADERPEDLYQRLMAFVDDNLLTKDSGISHHGDPVDEDEDMSPSLENFIVLHWLHLINNDLPALVKQRYGTELRSRTLASIKPEISQALDSLLEELHTSEDAKVLRSAASRYKGQHKHYSTAPRRSDRVCPLCKQAGRREYDHYLSKCSYLPDKDRQFMSHTRQITAHDVDSTEEHTTSDSDSPTIHSITKRVQVKQSPYIDAFYKQYPVKITIDTGAETNMVRVSWAKRVGASIKKSSQQNAFQADGQTPLKVIGETHVVFSHKNVELVLEALVVEDLDVDILGGVPFTDLNDISVRTSRKQITVGDSYVLYYGDENKCTGPHVRRTQAYVIKAPPATRTVWPDEYIEMDVPNDVKNDKLLAVEPRIDSPIMRNAKMSQLWPFPDIVTNIGGKIRIPNMTDEIKVLKKHEHFCQVRAVNAIDMEDKPIEIAHRTTKSSSSSSVCHSGAVDVDPSNMLPVEIKRQFQSLLSQYNNVFNPRFEGYNGGAGNFKAVVNMGPVQPPQRKGRLPQYARDKLVELQSKFDELEDLGVFVRPEDTGIVVEYLNPSFLIKKPSGGFRLVTAFADVGRYSKPQPSLMPDVDSTLRRIACWKYIITSDLTNAFYQIPLAKESMKYCGVVTPFRGVRVYTRSAMGMPGSETALEELMCRVLGDLLQEGVVAKLADDLYCGGNTLQELLYNWQRTLEALHRCNLRLSAKKTVICPQETTVLGWVWSQGTLTASSHRVATLAACTQPHNVRGLRSYIGAYKVLARVIPHCASLLSPLENAIAGLQSTDKVTWSDELQSAFHKTQEVLSENKTITMPRSRDQLWIVTDGSVKQRGLGATLYTTRSGKPKLAGFFSAKVRKHQVTWLPCEIEALCIAAAVKHFSPYIIQSDHTTCILTDSKPCVQAFEKLCRGEFSASPRVSTFLSVVSRFQASVRHLAGVANVPSDFASRNAPECQDENCQICIFVRHTEDSVVRHMSVQDVISGDSKLPYITRSTWLKAQSECKDLRRVCAHLKQGTRPSKKVTNVKDIKRYLHTATIARDGLLIVKENEPLAASRERIIVPRQMLSGLLTALHIKLVHPTCHQLRQVVCRHFYALDMDKSLEQVSKSCYTCASLMKVPHFMMEQSQEAPPDTIGTSFAADILKRQRQLILVLRETVTSYTTTCFINDERRDTLRVALVQLCSGLRPIDGPMSVIRVDPAPGFSALNSDKMLQENSIQLEIGRTKNNNKNPVAERAIQELEDEILRQNPGGGPITPVALTRATARLNARIRHDGMSAWEMWNQRDQYTHDQLPITDRQLIKSQQTQRAYNHPHSEKSKAHGSSAAPKSNVSVGDLVYLYADRNKSCARNRYLVVEVNDQWCLVRKFSGSQLRAAPYRVKLSECYKVPEYTHLAQYTSTHSPATSSDEDEYSSGPDLNPEPPSQPQIPVELSLPASHEQCLDVVTTNNQTDYPTATRPLCKYPLRNRLREMQSK